jgi:hypothetical protein
MGYGKIKKIKLSKYDKIWSQFVRERDGECLYDRCHRTEGLNAHYFKGRSCKSTRLLLINGVTLCACHHVFSSDWSAHKTPEKFEKWFKKTYPERYQEIRKRAQIMMSERDAITEFIEQYNL